MLPFELLLCYFLHGSSFRTVSSAARSPRQFSELNTVLTAAVHWMTSRQESSPALSLKSSPALLSSHSFVSWDSASSSWHSKPAKTKVVVYVRNKQMSSFIGKASISHKLLNYFYIDYVYFSKGLMN
jgi:hypothetical protein